VAGWTDGDGVEHETQRPPAERIMREETAGTMLELLTAAIDDGIAKGAQIPGYTVAGKTGTAQVAGPVEVKNAEGETVERWQYMDGWIDSSYVGLLPAGDTKLVVLILIHRPAVWGLYKMAERPESTFARLMPQVLDYLAIPPDRPLDAVAQP
jgi:cell division protein FtsI/penicillin-binding protein 2